MNSFKNRLKQIMSERSISQSELSRRTGIGRNSISDYLKGKYEAKQDKVFELAKVLNVNEAWLMGFDISKDRIINDNDITTVYNQLTPPRQHNVLDFANKQLEEQNNEVSENDKNIITIKRMHAAAAGVVGEELFDDLIEEDVEFFEDEVPKGADFCILVNGDSMEPMIKEGTYAFIKRETNIKDGTIALVVLDGTSFIKRVDIHPEYLKLISLNPKYEDITVSSFNDLKVVGKIVL
ncbi:LexA family transcriptional regulator [Staphylococcus simulans]|uniref:LexA family transcriptional regulator n=1 Tax=Staphylococcus simulans TaxID=1286 RepID=UPI000D1ED68F|nr:LexA family transcriptional regulator [Staphylococcus simulans]PTJ15920.1 peptidase S24 [Staphylococcus simulans]